MILRAAGDIHGALDRMYEDVLAFEAAIGVCFEWVLAGSRAFPAKVLATLSAAAGGPEGLRASDASSFFGQNKDVVEVPGEGDARDQSVLGQADQRRSPRGVSVRSGPDFALHVYALHRTLSGCSV